MKQPVRDYFLHALYLSLSVFLLWLWLNNPVLLNYNLQLTAFMVLTYFSVKMLAKKGGVFWDVIIATVVLLLILASTGGLASPFFFLLYFLLFAAAMLFEPPFTVTLTLLAALFFANTLTSLHAALQLLSLLFITPLAMYFGRQYLRLLETQEKIKILAKQGQKLEKEITGQETDSLLWLSLNLKDGLLKIVHLASELLSDIGRLGPVQKEKLQSIHESAKELLKSGEKLKQKIDKQTD